jgi:hypothetical protein
MILYFVLPAFLEYRCHIASFHLSAKTHDDKDLFKRRESEHANADTQFLRIRGGIPSEPVPLLEFSSIKTLRTSFTVN